MFILNKNEWNNRKQAWTQYNHHFTQHFTASSSRKLIKRQKVKNNYQQKTGRNFIVLHTDVVYSGKTGTPAQVTLCLGFTIPLLWCISSVITYIVCTASMMQITFVLLKAYSPTNRTGSPQSFYKTCTLHKHKTYKHNLKVSPFSIALIKNCNKDRRCWWLWCWYHWPFRSVVSIPN